MGHCGLIPEIFFDALPLRQVIVCILAIGVGVDLITRISIGVGTILNLTFDISAKLVQHSYVPTESALELVELTFSIIA